MENPYEPRETVSVDDHSSKLTLGQCLDVAVGLFVIVMSMIANLYGNPRGPNGMSLVPWVRFGLELLLVVNLYNGRAWARYVMVVLLGLGVLAGLNAWLQFPPEGEPSGKVMLRVLSIGYLSCVVMLLVAPGVSQLMESQRKKRGEATNLKA